MEQLLTPEQTAQVLGVAVGTLMVWRCEKRYPLSYVKVGGRIRYRASDIEKFVAHRVVECGQPMPAGRPTARKSTQR